MIQIYTNAAGTKRFIVNGSNGHFKDQNILSVHSKSEFVALIEKHHLVETPITHRSYNLSIQAAGKELTVRVTLFNLEKDLPGLWFRGEITRTTSDRRVLPCYFSLIPVRKKRGVYEFRPVVNMIHLSGAELSMFRQEYDGYEPIKESVLKNADYVSLGIVGKTRERLSVSA